MKECCGSPKDNPKTLALNISQNGFGTSTTFKVSGMDCADEVKAIEGSLQIPGVSKIHADLMKESVTIFHSQAVTRDDLAKLIAKAGVKVVDDGPRSFYQDHSRRIVYVGLSGAILAAGLLGDYFLQVNQSYSLAIFMLSIFFSGLLIFPKAWRSIKEFRFDMNVLMTLAVIGAVFIREYSEAASVVFLFSLAELLEAMSVSRARRAIQEVMKITAKMALVLDEDGKAESRNVEDLAEGDIILVRPNDNIATDGTIEHGVTSVNQASLTGESVPVEKAVGDQVFGGTINISGVIKVRVDKKFQDSKLAHVISLIETAQSEKAPSQRFVDRFASIYTPAVFAFAVLMAVLPPALGYGTWNEWLYKSLVFLVIGCPCALVIATPVSVVSGLTALAKKGILVKGGVHLETLGKLRALAVDKTGTITEGKPSVVSIKMFSDIPEEEALRIASSLESMSSHPLATAILQYTQDKGISWEAPMNFKVVVGKGAEGVVDEHPYFVGNHKLAHELGVCTPEVEDYLEEVEEQAMSVIVLGHRPHEGCRGEIIAIFALADQIRKGIERTVAELHAEGVATVIMLSGDNEKTVNAVAKKVQIDMAKGGLLPEDKVEEIKKLVSRFKVVGMVGDGVNDAPALANASLGIAMGVVGSDTAIETADVALMKDDFATIPLAVRLGRRVLNVIRFNIAFAIGVKVVFFGLAFAGMTNLWMAVAADMGASLLVTFNALRLIRAK